MDPRLVVISDRIELECGSLVSKGRPGLNAASSGTARRLMPMRSTPAQNVNSGVRYLSMMLDRYNGDVHKALAGL